MHLVLLGWDSLSSIIVLFGLFANRIESDPLTRQGPMEKSRFTEDYELLLTLLRDTRKRVGVTQVQIAETLAWTQSVVSKCERGERRLDAIELRQWVLGLGVSFPDFLNEFETLVGQKRKPAKHVVRRGKK